MQAFCGYFDRFYIAVFICINVRFKSKGRFPFSIGCCFYVIARLFILRIFTVFAFFRAVIFSLDNTGIDDANFTL
jgi:hypothetical protein